MKELVYSGLNFEIDKRSGLIPRNELNFLGKFIKVSWIVLILSVLIQCIIFWSVENFFASVCVLIAWSITTTIVLTKKNLNNYSLSTFLIIGFALTQYLLPIVFILLEGKPLVYNLKYPFEVFIHSILALIVLVISHLAYKALSSPLSSLRFKLQKSMKFAGLFNAPKDSEVWIMGIIGLLAMFASYFFIKQSFQNESEGSGNKFIEGLVPFTYSPYLLLVKALYGASSSKLKGYIPKILVFTALLFAVGIGANARSLFITGIVAGGIAYFLGLLLGKLSFRFFSGKNFAIVAFFVWLATGPLADIGTAMVVVRSQRGSISKTEMLLKTLDTYDDKEALRSFKKMIADSRINLVWDEHYFDNIFLARFCNLKFNDLSIEQANKINQIDEKMQNYSLDRLWSIFPQPVLSLLQVDLDKKTVLSSSFGDYLYFRSGGSANALGGFRTGQFAGTGMAAFGWWYLLLLGLGIIPVYFLLDLFVISIKSPVLKSRFFRISFAGLLSITSIFMFLSLSSTSESVINIFTYILRGWIQIVLLYWIVYALTRKLVFILK